MWFLFAFRPSVAGRNEEELRLLERIGRHDQAAFAELYDRYASVVYALLMRMIRIPAEAEDVLQETFLQIWKKGDTYVEAKGTVYTWIITIARNKAIDHLRSAQQNSRFWKMDENLLLRLQDETHTSNPLSAAISTDYERFVSEGFATLSPEQRRVIEMSYYEGHTQAQISDHLELPLGTVKTRMRQGMIKLRDFLRDRIER